MRTILHLDMNSFFASVEQAANPFLRGKPIVVGGGPPASPSPATHSEALRAGCEAWRAGIEKTSVVAAASYEAKDFGVKSAMPTWEAKKLCPNLIIVVGDMTKYIHTSKEITSMLTRYTDLVEVFSIDEAFMDITNTKEMFNGEIVIAKEIKRWIRERFHLTCNIGIGPNKLMAKFAGELKKPDALIIIRTEDIPRKIENVEVSKLCGIGRKIEKYLAEMRIKTFGELHRCPREKLIKRFGTVCGEHLWQMGQGIDHSPVLPYYHETDPPATQAETCEALRAGPKSMGHSYTLPKFTNNMEEVKGYLLRLSEQVGRRLRQDNFRGNIIHVSLGFGNFQFWGRQKKIEDFIDDGYEIYKIAERLICERKTTNYESRGFRFVGVSVSGLLHKIDQISLLPKKEDNKKVLKAVDKINDRFGEFTVKRAATMKTVLRNKAGMVPRRMFSGKTF